MNKQLSNGRRRLSIEHKPRMTSDGGDYTCQISLSSENLFIALQQPTVTNVTHSVIVMSEYDCVFWLGKIIIVVGVECFQDSNSNRLGP